MEIDITLEFPKTCIYVSKITKCKTEIKVNSAVILLLGEKTKWIICKITSTKGIVYDLSELNFEPKYTQPIGLNKKAIH